MFVQRYSSRQEREGGGLSPHAQIQQIRVAQERRCLCRDALADKNPQEQTVYPGPNTRGFFKYSGPLTASANAAALCALLNPSMTRL